MVKRKKKAVAKKKVAKRGPGRPPKKKAGRPRKAGPGRPRKKTTARKVAAKKTTVELPVNSQTDVDFWSNLVGFLNDNRGKGFVIQLDGKTFALGAR
jgi:hypothetical protein